MEDLVALCKRRGFIFQSDEIYLLKNFQDNLIENVVLRGIKNIDKVILRKDPNVMRYQDGKYMTGMG